jgi:hypothetical protein
MDNQANADRYADIIDRLCIYDEWPESPDFRIAFQELRFLAESGHTDAAESLADRLAAPGSDHDPEAAYKWYYVAFSLRGYRVQFEDQNLSPPYYCGPLGDFRNDCRPNDLIVSLGFEKVQALDRQAARWLAERNLKVTPKKW